MASNRDYIKYVAEKSGKSIQSVYRRAKILGRLPTVEEVANAKAGRPPKYTI